MENKLLHTSSIRLVVMVMDDLNNTSGVTRYMQMLLKGLKNNSSFEVFYIRFVQDTRIIFTRRRQTDHYLEITIPLPLKIEELVKERYWTHDYNEFVFDLFQDILTPGCLLHLKTLNLIDLALYIKQRIPCKIISHLHCIPWKSLYNKNKRSFNRLYNSVYNRNNREEAMNILPQVACERDFYHKSDRIICVTRCAADFLIQYMNVPASKIEIIFNGLEDNNKIDRDIPENGGSIQLLYVGILSESKGILYILEALRVLSQKGYRVTLNIAGRYGEPLKKRIEDNYKELEVNLLGLIPFDELAVLYSKSDIGVIASLQEQCSYVALEMMMFGLPVVSTFVDGLGEIFEDEKTALKVNTCFSPVYGLSADSAHLASQLIRLITDTDLRSRLGDEARKTFVRFFKLSTMMQRTVALYKSVVFPIK